MFHRLVGRFLGDKRASMATQVVVFSVMLFGMSGVVLDFGRVFNEHSRMQAFTDQAALAAARELDSLAGEEGSDGSDNAIVRAVGAVFTPSGEPLIHKVASGSTSDDDAEIYRISHLFFLRELSEDTGAQYELGDDLVGDNMLYMYEPGANIAHNSERVRTAATEARFVVAIGEERSVLNSLMGLVNAAEDSGIDSEQKIRTVSVAESRVIMTGELSNLAVCNPWEGNPQQSAADSINDPSNRGLHFQHRADGFSNGAQFTAENSLLVREVLEASDAVNDVCNDPLRLPGFDLNNTAAENELARRVCILAAADRVEFSVGEEMAVRAADPEEITTSLNTIFDMWDEPIAEVVEWDRDANGIHSQAVDHLGNSLFDPASSHPQRADAALFQPAINIMKGRIWHEPTANDTATAFGVPASSRLNYPRIDATREFEAIIHSCVRPDSGLNGLGCYVDATGQQKSYISEPITWRGVLDYYAENFAAHYQSNFFTNPPESLINNFAQAESLQISEWMHNDGFAPYTNFVTGEVFEIGDSFARSGEDGNLLSMTPGFNPQIQVQRCFDPSGDPLAFTGDHTNPDDENTYCQGHFGDVPRPAPDPDDPNSQPAPDDADVLARATVDREPSYPNFTFNPVVQPATPEDSRRRLDVTLVNCGGAEVRNGMIYADVAAFAQVYLLTPPRVTCSDGTEVCTNDQITHVDIYSELVEPSDGELDHYAVLVR